MGLGLVREAKNGREKNARRAPWKLLTQLDYDQARFWVANAFLLAWGHRYAAWMLRFEAKQEILWLQVAMNDSQ